MNPDPQRHVVVTGLGAVTPLGLSVPDFWEALLRGTSGARLIESFDTGVGGMKTFLEQTRVLLTQGARRISPFFIPMLIPNMASGYLAIRYGFQGPSHCVVSACATGNHCLADALDQAVVAGRAGGDHA